MQYFHEWRSHEWKYNSWCSRMKYISILYVKQINFLFISCFLSDFKYFLLILPRNVAHSPLWRHHIMTSHHQFWNLVLLHFSNFCYIFNMMYGDIDFLFLKKQNLRMTAFISACYSISLWFSIHPHSDIVRLQWKLYFINFTSGLSEYNHLIYYNKTLESMK